MANKFFNVSSTRWFNGSTIASGIYASNFQYLSWKKEKLKYNVALLATSNFDNTVVNICKVNVQYNMWSR